MELDDDGEDTSVGNEHQEETYENFDGLSRDSSFLENEDDNRTLASNDDSGIALSKTTGSIGFSSTNPTSKGGSSSNSIPTKKVIDEVKAPIHAKMLEALQEKSNSLNPLHVDIKNESYWYQQRKKLGTKRHNAIIVKYNKNTMKYDGYIYRMKLREKDLEIVPTKTVVGEYGGGFKTKWAAHKACEQACKERDENPAVTSAVSASQEEAKNKALGQEKALGKFIPATRIKIDPGKILCTHFKILVVSEKFTRLNYMERVCLVYQQILASLGVQAVPVNSRANAPSAESKEDSSNSNTLTDNSSNNSGDCSKETPHQNTREIGGMGMCAPVGMKLASYYHSNVCNLPLLRFLLLPDSCSPFFIMLDCKTPSQWRPEIYKPLVSERLGSAHTGFRNLNLEEAAKNKSHKSRVRKLTTTTNDNGNFPQLSNADRSKKNDQPLSDTLGLDAAVSGVQYKKLGGIYGHFFNDLSPDVRDMVLSRYRDNKELITQVHSSIIPSSGSGNKAKKLRDKIRAAGSDGVASGGIPESTSAAEYDVGTTTEAQMMEEVSISNLKIGRVVGRLQRIRRTHMFRRAIQSLWKREYATISIQRVVRGLFGRLYAALWRKIFPVAGRRIWRCWKNCKSRRIRRSWKVLTRRLTRWVLPKMKRFICNCYLSWISKREAGVLRIQRCIRQYLVKCRRYNRLGRAWFMEVLFPRAALMIQKVVRGHIDRTKFRICLDKFLIWAVTDPAVMRVQRVSRGNKGRKIAARKRVELAACKAIQRCARLYVRQIWNAQLKRAQLEKAAATRIQKVLGRGVRDREIYKMKAYQHWYTYKFMPAVVLTQSVARRWSAIKRVVTFRLRMKAAAVIQRGYRAYVQQKLAKILVTNLKKARIFAVAVKIQKTIRRMLARIKYEQKRIVYKGTIIKAGRIIMRAWINYRLNLKYQKLIIAHRIKGLMDRKGKFLKSRLEIQQDMAEVEVDIELNKKRILKMKGRVTQIVEFMAQSAVRLTNVKGEMKLLQADDFEKGWAEALVQEYEYLNHCQLLGREELRLLRVQIIKRKREVEALYLEYEESELELDKGEVIEIESIEAIRRAEVNLIDKKTGDEMAKNIREERGKWKIEGVRTHVIRRNRQRYRDIVDHEKDGRDISYATTVVYENRAQVRDTEQLTTQQKLENDNRKLDEDIKPRGFEEYATPVQDTYDNVVASTLSILRGFSLEEQATRIKEQAKVADLSKRRAQKGQFSSLKEENQRKGI